ncbi:Probable methyltransferase PMT14 [Striga hermonthica]|uniref:Methyltransferase n=1 Tax=Striga hermonthica TaxID=68872 RepID=A0A9N7P092_STRHE|nr:Probable methyltransferase PMT14 [Striga hermonthica]
MFCSNVPFKSLTDEKAGQNWVQFQGNVFKFPGGGTMFPQGADAYINELARVIPIADGSVRTALDTGCGVASLGAYMLKRNVLAMSFATRDNHEAQVQFALARAGMYLMEVDRVLRPGGYWVLSGPPVNWKTYFPTWKRIKEDLKAEQSRIEDLVESLCWEKKYEKGDVAIWRKEINAKSCKRKSANYCQSSYTDGELKKFPARLFDVPPRILNGDVLGVTSESYEEDNKLWKKHISSYKRSVRLLGSNRFEKYHGHECRARRFLQLP